MPGTTVEKLATLKPVFRPDGEVTAGNACPLNDGAAAVIVMSDTKAKELGITPLARIVSRGVSALNPEIMGLGPIEASRQALRRAGLTIDDIDLVEINEAFAAQVIPSAKHLGIPMEKLNVHGGAIALGHPFGMTGARIMTTLINGLQTDGKRYGLETMCVGGGQGMAMIIERLSRVTRQDATSIPSTTDGMDAISSLAAGCGGPGGLDAAASSWRRPTATRAARSDEPVARPGAACHGGGVDAGSRRMAVGDVTTRTPRWLRRALRAVATSSAPAGEGVRVRRCVSVTRLQLAHGAARA